MIHIKDDFDKTICGLDKLPIGDVFFFSDESASWLKSDCPTCNPGGPKQLGTPVSQLSGRPNHNGFNEFKRIAESWGYE